MPGEHVEPILLADGLLASALTDARGVLCGFNARFLADLGFTARQLAGHPLAHLFDEELRDEVARVLGRVLAGVPHHVVWRTRLASGGEIHCEWQLAPRTLRGGDAAGLSLTLVPVEGQRRDWRRLNETQERFRSIASGVAAMVWVSGPDGVIRNSNRAWRDFLGGDYPSRDVWRVVLHPDDYPAVMELRAGATDHGPPRIGAYRLLRHDGRYRWIEERVLRQTGDDGETLMVASCNDITEQREMRERLEHALAQTEGILDGALDAIVTVDQRGRIVSFNPAAEKLFGFKADEILGHRVARLLPARFHQGHLQSLRRFAQGDEAPRRVGGVGSGIMGLRADGTEFPLEASISVIRTPSGLLQTTIIRDISPQVSAMQELTDREARLRLAMDSANLGWAELDADTGRLTVNQATAHIFGLGDDPKDWVLSNFLEPIFPEDRDFVRKVVETIIREDRQLDAELRIVRPSGEVRWVYGRGRLYRNEEGRPQRVIAVVMDINERKHTESQLRALSQRVLAAHEDERRRIARELHDQIGQSLTAALINLQMLPLDLHSGPAKELQVALSAVLTQVRELSLNLRPSMLDSLGLEAALRWYLERQAALGRFKIELSCPSSSALPPETETVVFRLVQEAMTNILRHAKARHVRVQVEKSGEEAVVTVHDDGVGFDAAHALARASGGGSFGLLGMRERAELAGGVLEFRSRPGEGTTVTAVLPVKRAA